MPEEEIESLELDKLETSAKEQKQSEPSESIEDTEDGEQPSKKPSGVGTRILGILMDRGFIISLLVGVVLAGVVYYFMSVRHIPSETGENAVMGGQITYSGSAPVGFKYFVHFKLLVPFKDADEKRLLMEKLGKIRPELMALSQDPDVAKSLREKDVDAIKAEIIAIASRITNVPLMALELSEITIE